ncbi:MAG: hypothetical protein FD175_1095 [Beijerinckiaceae bacterium]|nr:MAG: hypothetical protein FD175_1095 [Beijerinckiaceae bacterium]
MDDIPARRPTALARVLPAVLSLPTLSLLIASLSLISSISQSYNYRKNIESVQQNVLRAENLKTCRDIIEVFFAFRLRAEEANARAGQGALDAATAEATRRDLKGLVYRFGALGTYLANFTPATARERYSALSWSLNAIAAEATSLKPAEFEAKFAAADKAFGTLNEDCAKSAQFVQF